MGGRQLEVEDSECFGDESRRSERWNLDVAGSTNGGRDFGPCSYPRRGWTLNTSTKIIITIII